MKKKQTKENLIVESRMIKAYCLYNTEWKDWGWNNPLQQLPFSYKNEDVIFPLAIFETLKEARHFYKCGNRKEIKIIKCEIKFWPH